MMPKTGVVSFPNLGNDAVLIVPCPIGPSAAYRHLASFLREGCRGTEACTLESNSRGDG
jgi:hypothetical protein